MNGLTPAQQHEASFLIGFGLAHGLSPQHAREFAAAAYAESRLDKNATNKSSGAAGLFQLLSQGYVRRASSLGGVYNDRANAEAIIGSYERYWRSHPNAQPGQAGAAVEASGEGPGFYASPLSLVGGVSGGAAPVGGGGGAQPGQALQSPQVSAEALLAAFSPKGGISTSGLLRALAPQPQQQQAQLPAEGLPPARRGAGGASEMLAAIRKARELGLHVGENPIAGGVDYGVHAKNSYHKLVYPGTQIGRAIDVSGDRAAEQAFYSWVKANLRTSELLQEGTGGPTHSTGPHIHVAI
jgi:hypothetical protein